MFTSFLVEFIFRIIRNVVKSTFCLKLVQILSILQLFANLFKTSNTYKYLFEQLGFPKNVKILQN